MPEKEVLKKLLLIFFVLFSINTFAQEKKISAGLGPEWNMDSRHNFAAGVSFSMDYTFSNLMALGFSVTGSNNFNGFQVLEGVVLVRQYHPGSSGFFAQGDMGTLIFFENGEVNPMPLFGLRLGFRRPMSSTFALEPYGRLGYPFAFGIGLTAKIHF